MNILINKYFFLFKQKKSLNFIKIFFNLKFYLINKILINKIINIFIN